MRVLDLFSGIGGFSLGLERAGMRTVQFVEIDPFCRHVLHEHWPGIPCHEDIRTFHAPSGFADVVCGGFPCQDISVAGAGAGLQGERSGLWADFARVIGEVRPRFVIVENVSALLHRGLGNVLADLAALGYDAEWHCIPAATVGAPHRRDRIWIVAYPNDQGESQPQGPLIEVWRWLGDGSALCDPDSQGLQIPRTEPAGEDGRDTGGMPTTADWWASEPDVGRVAHGVPSRVDRLRALGNAVVPQVVEVIGRAIMTLERQRDH